MAGLQLRRRALSRGELQAISRLIEPGDAGIRVRSGAEEVSPEEMKELGLSPREISELREKLRPAPVPEFDLDLTRMRTAEEIEVEMYKAVSSSFE